MNEHAVIMAVSRGVMATLVDGTVRIKIDIEPADAAKAFALMGMPGSPVAIAALAPGTPSPDVAQPNPAPEPEKRTGGPLAKLAGMWCGDAVFADWIADTHGELFVGALSDADGDIDQAATAVLRSLCGIESRVELDHDAEAAARFHARIRQPFMEYHEKAAA